MDGDERVRADEAQVSAADAAAARTFPVRRWIVGPEKCELYAARPLSCRHDETETFIAFALRER